MGNMVIKAIPAQAWKMPYRIMKSPVGLRTPMDLFMGTPKKRHKKVDKGELCLT